MDRRYAILGDIHANLEALTAVEQDARSQGVTDFVCVGDIVGYNANPSECIRIFREHLGGVSVRGNHDHYCSFNERLDDFQPLAASVIAWTRRQLAEEDAKWLRTLPLSRAVTGIMLVHSTLDMPGRWGYVFDALDAEAHFSYQTTVLCFHGHTHVPIVFEKQKNIIRTEPTNLTLQTGIKYFVNTGSVGQPRDGDPRSSYVIYHPKMREVTFRRVEYDVATAVEKNRRAGLPERLAQRLIVGR
jgi:diadenosine tetraphosphatase ApaH/serine/threonine PP2A family protein phosphatase